MPPTLNRNLPEVVSELIIEMHEVRSVPSVLNGLVDWLEQTVKKEFEQFRNEMRQHTDRFINTFSRTMKLLINRVLDYETRLSNFENPQD
jgi:hypothetical protein